jgi:enoyl-[acyl-carrier protein] reductase III
MSVCVTGGSSGIGRAIAERLARPGGDVFVNYHSNDAAAADTAAAIEAKGATAHLCKLDVGTIEGVRELAEEMSSKVDRLDQLVHSAAMAVPGALLDMDAQTLEDAVRTNGTSLVHLVRETMPLLKPGSSVFFVTSAGSRKAMPGYGSLGAPKALAEHFARYLAIEVAARGIRVNCISPGPVDTMARRLMFPETWKERLEAQDKANPSGHGVELDDVAGVVELMSRPEFSMVQGQIVAIDGGLHLA